MARASTLKTFVVALLIALSCAGLVSVTAVGLVDRVQANKDRERLANMLLAAGVDVPDAVEFRIVELDTGEYVSSADIGTGTYDQREAASDPGLSDPIPADDDLAEIGRRERYAYVGLIREGERLDRLILPVRGLGYGGMIHGIVVLDGDLTTVRNLYFTEHEETPGLGAEITEPSFRARWPGKRIYDEDGEVRIEVVRGAVDPDSAEGQYQVEGISGATITSESVTLLLQYWFAASGFETYLERLRRERGDGG
ncbi:MAG TPA: NADH:ubiquinone reductase (Na(+)-transporting) subunit C [Vicinamibacteria bacterium]|nr:NADH:ubiquinone reductase (Na(+)-transporting) subunit C [Vicinamibacteria bacterium]